MTSPSAFPDFVDLMVSIADTALTVPVFDGPWLRDDEPEDGYVSIGWDGDPENLDQEVGDISQEWASIGDFVKNEMVDLTCGAVAWDGGGDVKAARDLVFGYVSTLEQALRAALAPIGGNASLQALVLWCGVTAGAPTQGQLDQGARVRVPFTIHYQARI